METKELRRHGVNFALLLGGALVVAAGWYWLRPGRATTAREFVQEYRSAWSRGDVDAVLRMEASDPRTPETARRESVAQELASRRLGYQIWTRMSYAGERDHDDHVHLVVRVAGVPSDEMLLVREDGVLLLHPHPEALGCTRSDGAPGP